MYYKDQSTFPQCFKTFVLFLMCLAHTALSGDLNYIDNWGVTRVNMKKISYAWTINNFTFCDRDTGEMLESPVFPNDDSDEYKWRLRLYPKGYSSSYDGYVTLFLKLVSGQNRVKVVYKLALLSSENNEINSKSITTNFAKDSVYGYYEFIPRSHIFKRENDLLPDDKLTVTVEIIINQGLVNISGGCSMLKPVTQPDYSHANNFEKLVGNELFSDVRLSVGQYDFPAHKAVLAAVSPVFLEQFKNAPSDTKFVINVEVKILKEILHYIYTGTIGNIERIANKVLPVASEYQIEQLKSLCEEIICQSLNTTNAIDVLTLAEEHGAERLRLQASNFIAAHALKVVNTQSFKSMEVSRPHPILRIFRALVQNVEK